VSIHFFKSFLGEERPHSANGGESSREPLRWAGTLGHSLRLRKALLSMFHGSCHSSTLSSSLIRPIFCATHVAVANWIVYKVVQLLCVGLGSAQLAVPKLPLPNRSLSAVRPRSRDVISPILDPILQRVRGKCVRGTEQMDVIRHDHVTDRHARASLLATTQRLAVPLRRWQAAVFAVGYTP
jgi:hypothetical protein